MSTASIRRHSDPDAADSYDVEFHVAPGTFDREGVHLWIDPAAEPSAHSLVSVNMTKSEALLLGVALMKEATK